jgi:F420H(2)-dependent quinone reductase
MTGQLPAPASAVQHDHPQSDQEHTMSEPSKTSASLPPRWFIRLFWVVQRAVYSVTRGRFGLRTATADHEGYMRLRTVGRRSGEERIAILAYFEDGPDLVTMAMNGWADAEPAWWLNLEAQPDVTVDLPGGSRAVHGRAADEDERPRLWARWAALDKDLDGYAARRSRETAVVILSPRPANVGAGIGGREEPLA